jgi:membrane fusion protein
MQSIKAGKPILTTVSAGQERELFPARLPSWVVLATGLLMILVAGAALIGAVVVPVPDTVRCPFTLIPEGGADPVRATTEGTLSRILAAPTEGVKKGEELFVIRSKEIQSWTTELRTLEQERRACRQRAILLADLQRKAVEIQKAKIGQHEKDLLYQQEYLKVLKTFLERIERLGGEGLVPEVDVLSQRLSASKAERDVASTRELGEMAALELDKMGTEYDRQTAELTLEEEKIALREASLRRLLRDCQEDVVRVRSPFDGTVVSVERKNPGDVVSFGEELCRIARSDAALLAELAPPEDGVSRLQAGQKIQLFFKAFPYERFGTGTGTLKWISPAAVASQDGARFVVLALLDLQSMDVQGQARPLRAGMKGEARILVGRRTIIEYVFEPIRRLRENWPQSK